MKKLLLLAILILNLTNSFSQSLKRNIGESVEQFVERTITTKKSKITGKVIESKWNSEIVIFAFITIEKNQKKATEQYLETNVEGYVFIPISKNVYQKVLIDSYGEDGAVAEVESVFFSNADQDKQSELLIMCTWDQSRHYNISGKFYHTYIYDNVDMKTIPEKLKPLNNFDKIFEEFDGKNDSSETSKAKYINAAKVKRKLKEMGF